MFYKDQEAIFGDPDVIMDERTSTEYNFKISVLDSLVAREASTDEFYSYTGINVKFSRKTYALTGNYFGPTMVFVMLSWLSFAIPVHQVTSIRSRQKIVLTFFIRSRAGWGCW